MNKHILTVLTVLTVVATCASTFAQTPNISVTGDYGNISTWRGLQVNHDSASVSANASKATNILGVPVAFGVSAKFTPAGGDGSETHLGVSASTGLTLSDSVAVVYELGVFRNIYAALNDSTEIYTGATAVKLFGIEKYVVPTVRYVYNVTDKSNGVEGELSHSFAIAKYNVVVTPYVVGGLFDGYSYIAPGARVVYDLSKNASIFADVKYLNNWDTTAATRTHNDIGVTAGIGYRF